MVLEGGDGGGGDDGGERCSHLWFHMVVMVEVVAVVAVAPVLEDSAPRRLFRKMWRRWWWRWCWWMAAVAVVAVVAVFLLVFTFVFQRPATYDLVLFVCQLRQWSFQGGMVHCRFPQPDLADEA